ncbi:hypothetical protein AUJ65_04265 [Candidatus Micrarchaeota archaeon CG1_02_51_15]|nr:MAG: hypothetical protein AUJ65_04265 [Candidatus Micrarchaeota archaeon CG1_02_51_15]
MRLDLRKLKADKKKNFEERLDFISRYVEWLKKTPNAEWSKQQNVVINQFLTTRKRRANPA